MSHSDPRDRDLSPAQDQGASTPDAAVSHDRRFPLLRHFAVASGLAILIIANALAFLYRYHHAADMLADSQAQNTALAQTFANAIWPRFSDFVERSSQFNAETLRSHPEQDELRSAILDLAASVPVLRVKIYTPDGLTVFSTDRSQIGEIKPSTGGFGAAQRGENVSKELSREVFEGLDGEVTERVIVESYLPLKSAGGQLESVFELHTDVTAMQQRIDDTTVEVILALLIGFATLFTVLYLVIRHTDKILARQYGHLEASQDQLNTQKVALEFEIYGRQRMEDSLRENAAMLRQTARMANLGHWVWDQTEHRYLLVSDELAEIFGYTGEEFLGQFSSFDARLSSVHPEDRAQLSEAIRQKNEKDDVYEVEYRYLTREGDYRHYREYGEPRLDESGQRTRTVGFIQDITALKASEDALRQSETSLARAQRLANVGSWRWSVERDELIGCSDEYARIHGVTIDGVHNLLKHQMERVIHPDDRERVERSFSDFDESGDNFEIEYRILRPDGAVRHILELGEAVFDETGRLIEQTGTVQDITDRKEAEYALEAAKHNAEKIAAELAKHRDHLEDLVRDRTNELVRHRDHLEELVGERTAEVQQKAAELEQALETEREFNSLQREFVSLASHEFRTPLAIIDATARSIGRRFDRLGPDDLNERVGRIRDAVGRMNQLIDSTLSAGRLDAGQIEMTPAPTNLKTLLQQITDRQQQITPNREINLDVDNLPETIAADGALLDQAFTNLLTNAIKYSPGGEKVEIGALTDGQTVSVSFRDYGLGIPKEELPRLFQRYFRASTTTGMPGTGLGLHLSDELVRMHGGRITVQSTLHEGSTFTMHLPIETKNSPTMVDNKADDGPQVARRTSAR